MTTPKTKALTPKRAWTLMRSLLAGSYPSYVALSRALGVSHVAVSKWDKRHEVPEKYHAAIACLWFASVRKGWDLITSYEITDWGKILGRKVIAQVILAQAAQVYDNAGGEFNRCLVCYASRYMGSEQSRVCSLDLDNTLCYDSGVYDPIEPAIARAVKPLIGNGQREV